jgi:hypothetical protein
MLCFSLSGISGYVPGPVLIVSPEGVLCEAPPRGLFHRAVSLIQPAYASILVAHVVAAWTLHGFALTMYGRALVIHKPMLDCRRNAGHSWTNEPPEPGGACR